MRTYIASRGTRFGGREGAWTTRLRCSRWGDIDLRVHRSGGSSIMATTDKVRCSRCGIESAATVELCSYCGASLHDAQDASTPAVEEPAAAAPGIGFPVPAMPFVGAVRSASTSLTRRYTDAYVVSRTVIALGGWVKVLGYVTGGVIALVGLVSAGQSPQSSLGVIATERVVLRRCHCCFLLRGRCPGLCSGSDPGGDARHGGEHLTAAFAGRDAPDHVRRVTANGCNTRPDEETKIHLRLPGFLLRSANGEGLIPPEAVS
jgi:hypothetical protein